MSYMCTYYVDGFPLIFSDFGIILPTDDMRINPTDPNLQSAIIAAFQVYDTINNVHSINEYLPYLNSGLNGMPDDSLDNLLSSFEKAKEQTVIELWDDIYKIGEMANKEKDRRIRAANRGKQPVKPHLPKSGIVYIFQSGAFCKIGYTTRSTEERIAELNRTRPEKITVIYTIKSDDIEKLEADLHHRFASQRRAGEWFSLSLDDIDQLKAEYNEIR